MAPANIPTQLQRATFRIAAVSFWGISAIVMASSYILAGVAVNYPVEWVITGLACVAGLVCWFVPWQKVAINRFIPVVFAGLVMLTIGVFATGGTRSHLTVLYLVVLVFTASMLAFRVALAVLAYSAVGGTLPVLVGGWDGAYVRSLIMLMASMVICAFIPALVRRALREENQLAERRRQELEGSYLATIEALAAALDAKDRHTEAHSRETAALSRAVGRHLGLTDESLRFLEFAALLHDIGKIGIPGYVLNKPGPLDDEETAIMREHPVIGERIVASVPFLSRIRPVVNAQPTRLFRTTSSRRRGEAPYAVALRSETGEKPESASSTRPSSERTFDSAYGVSGLSGASSSSASSRPEAPYMLHDEEKTNRETPASFAARARCSVAWQLTS